jgi:hypothetical protein
MECNSLSRIIAKTASPVNLVKVLLFSGPASAPVER